MAPFGSADNVSIERVVDQFFADYRPSEDKIAFFMAGIPGAGKTEFVEQTLQAYSTGYVPVEHDKLVEYIEGYRPENYYDYRKAGSALVTTLLDECLKHGYSFIFDGTLSHENGIRNIKKTLRAGYIVYVVYIVQDAAMAWQLTQAREMLKRRAIEKGGFIETCNKINQNLRNIFIAFKDNERFNFWLIHKQGASDMRNATAIIHDATFDRRTEVENALSSSYNIDSIE